MPRLLHLPCRPRAATPIVCLTAAACLAACAVPPAGPSFIAMPGPGKTVGQYQADDARCRAYANGANGGVSPSAGATHSAVGSAAIGTVLGAAAGALLGAAGGAAGVGAAFGAGTGLLIGSAAGAGNAQASGTALQQNYDVSYGQCMITAGNRVPMPGAYPAPYAVYGYGGAAPPPPVAFYGSAYAGYGGVYP